MSFKDLILATMGYSLPHFGLGFPSGLYKGLDQASLAWVFL